MKATLRVPTEKSELMPAGIKLCLSNIGTSLGSIMLTHGLRVVWFEHSFNSLLVDVEPSFEEIKLRYDPPPSLSRVRLGLVRRIAEIMALHGIDMITVEATAEELDIIESRWKVVDESATENIMLQLNKGKKHGR